MARNPFSSKEIPQLDRRGFLNLAGGCAALSSTSLLSTLVNLKMTNSAVAAGNDLSTPMPEYGFPGLKPGDRWCLCAQRWQEAFEAGMAPKVALESTHISALEFCDLSDMKTHAVDDGDSTA